MDGRLRAYSRDDGQVLWEIQTGRFVMTLAAVPILAFVVIFPSILSQLFFARSVELIGANRAAPFLHLVVLFGALLAIVLLGESLELYHVIGMALILPGVSLAARKP